jgi:hypothetical protein
MHLTPSCRTIAKSVGAIAMLLCAATQSAGSQAIRENAEMRLEVIGLKRWTLPMIDDSLRRYAPKDSLMSHACAGVLRETLKFADASVVYYTGTIGDSVMKPYLAVTVVEPQDSALIRYRAPFRDSLPPRRAWRSIRTVFDKHNLAFQQAMQRSEFLWSDAALAVADSALRPALPLRRFLRAHVTTKDRQTAFATLAANGNSDDRVVAVLLLANFAESDSTWWALAAAVRDPAAKVRSTAAQLLTALARRAPRRVDWTPVTPTLRTLIDGTNLFWHNQVMEVLAATQIDSALARPLLHGGGDLVLAKLRSQGMAERQASRRFLVQLAGRDLGESPAAWEEWIGGL